VVPTIKNHGRGLFLYSPLHRIFVNLTFFVRSVLVGFSLLGAQYTDAISPRDLAGLSDNDVLEVLAPRIKLGPLSNVNKTPENALVLAKAAIQNARATQEPRYLGQAQSILAPWWNRPDAPEGVAVLQATIEQSQHKFDSARKTLVQLLGRYPESSQAWLTLVSLERLAGQYSAALLACEKIVEPVYKGICRSDIQCHLGQSASAKSELVAIARRSSDLAALSWAKSLLGECEERSGDAAKAIDHYRASLALSPDGYTALALADALLRNNQPAPAMTALMNEPASDAVILRRAHAYRMLNNTRWKLLFDELNQRFKEAEQRGDLTQSHARERAYAALWLGDDFALAVKYSRINLQVQKEFIDWLLAFESALKSRDRSWLVTLESDLKNHGLVDKRLASAKYALVK
jgi:tetratricopeptide (TPR) repeat protein